MTHQDACPAINDLTALFIAEGREKASLAAFYESRTPDQLAGIEAVAMDMWEPTSKPLSKPFLWLPPRSSSTASMSCST